MKLNEIHNYYYHVTPKANLKFIKKYGLVPKTGPRSSMIGDYGIFLFKNLQSLEDALLNWLGDEFDENETLVILKVIIPDHNKIIDDNIFEVKYLDTIPPENLTVMRYE